MVRQHNPPVTMQVYLGSGKPGLKLRENIEKKLLPKQSVSDLIIRLMRKADPSLFKGVDDANK